MRFLTRRGCITAIASLTCAVQSAWSVPPQETRELSVPPLAQASLEDLVIPRRPIPYPLLGVNAFVNDSRYGSIRSQFREVRSTLGIKSVRVLFSWNDQIQATPTSTPFFGFFDEIINSLPADTNALVILTGVPSWMNDSKNWINGDPRKTFVERWIRPVVSRYAKRSRVIGWQIWNEPNNPSFSENVTLELLDSPTNYAQLVSQASAVAKALAPRKKVVNGATTAIAQNFPDTLSYNEAMIRAGLLNAVDVFAIHYYGKNVERVLLPDGVGDFLKGISKPIWVTESGIQGINRQLEYAQRIFPFLKDQAPNIARIYLYQFTESTPAATTYGLKNLTPGFMVSDLFLNLRNRQLARTSRRR